MSREEIIALVLAGNQAAMDWFALATDRPLPSQPSSILGGVLGADLGSGYSGTVAGSLSPTVILLALVAAFVLLSKK